MEQSPHLTVYQRPALHRGVLVVAFSGWPDAGESATAAVRYLTRSLPATLCASFDPEEFYNFTQDRPTSAVTESGERTVRWPANEFYFWKNTKGGADLLLFLGVEPHLKWRTFTRTLLGYAEACDARVLVTLGALLNAVPHTRAPRITGRTNDPELSRRLEAQGILQSGSGVFQGPTSVHSVLYDALRGTPWTWASLWGHASHYLPQVPNPLVSNSLLQRLGRTLDIDLDLREMQESVNVFREEMEKLLARNRDLRTYVRQLEEQYVAPSASAPEPMPNAEDLVRDMEEFLKRQRDEGPGGQGS
ncbi:MAG: PAC2 family protein [Dehalococcoidia bacterium]|nr:PAC2 family protein [Dehalococcoidia bacterium]